MLAQLEKENEISELTDECDRFCRYVHRIIGANVTVGIGQVCNHILDLSKSYSSARDAISYRVLYGTSRAINIQEVAPSEKNNRVPVMRQSCPLFKMIRLKEEPEIIGGCPCLSSQHFL